MVAFMTADKKNKNNLFKWLENKNNKITLLSFALILGVFISMIGYQVLIVKPAPSYDHTLTMPENLPSKIDLAIMEPESKDMAYNFAKDHQEILIMVNCYCGCMYEPLNHKNNFDCFWTKTGGYDRHASSCFTCIHIALTSKSLFKAGWPVSEISNYINYIYL
jgi:hypothetical protein